MKTWKNQQKACFITQHYRAFAEPSVVVGGGALEGVNNTSPGIGVDLRESRFLSKSKESLSLVK